MSSPAESRRSGLLLGIPLLGLLVLPLLALLVSSSPADLRAGLTHPSFAEALWLSARTSLLSLAIIVVSGTPLAWWLAGTNSRGARVVEALVDLPIVIPPAVMGIALLLTFGRSGIFGDVLGAMGVGIPFTSVAVVIAQVVVAAPFFVQAAASAFRTVDDDLMLVARTLGHSRRAAILRVAIPIAAPGLLAGAALAWARALGEFGATLLFAGNFAGSTQTMPLAIYAALESDVQLAVALALALAGAGLFLLVGLRAAPRWAARRGAA